MNIDVSQNDNTSMRQKWLDGDLNSSKILFKLDSIHQHNQEYVVFY